MSLLETIFVQPLLNGLLVFYHLFANNLGLSVIGFTVFIRLALVPLTTPSMRSMHKMRELAPELSKLKEKHKKDKTRLMQAQADFYKKKGVNPMAGCLPQIVQLVILIALFQVFIQMLSGNGEIAQKINRLAYPPLQVEGVVNTKFVYLDLARPDTIPVEGLPIPLPGPFLIAAALVQFLSSKMMAPMVAQQKKKAAKTKGQLDDIMASTQQQMIYLFPLLTLVIGFTFASGLVLYWFIFSLFQGVQQYFVSGWGGLTPWVTKIGLVKSNG